MQYTLIYVFQNIHVRGDLITKFVWVRPFNISWEYLLNNKLTDPSPLEESLWKLYI